MGRGPVTKARSGLAVGFPLAGEGRSGLRRRRLGCEGRGPLSWRKEVVRLEAVLRVGLDLLAAAWAAVWVGLLRSGEEEGEARAKKEGDAEARAEPAACSI